MIDFTLTTNKKEAAKVILEALDEGSLHYQRRAENLEGLLKDGDNGRAARYYQEFPDKTIGRCAIGQLFTVEQAMILEDQPRYMMAGRLIDNKILIVPEEEEDWFCAIQRRHDNSDLDDLRKMCEIAIAA